MTDLRKLVLAVIIAAPLALNAQPVEKPEQHDAKKQAPATTTTTSEQQPSAA